MIPRCWWNSFHMTLVPSKYSFHYPAALYHKFLSLASDGMWLLLVVAHDWVSWVFNVVSRLSLLTSFTPLLDLIWVPCIPDCKTTKARKVRKSIVVIQISNQNHPVKLNLCRTPDILTTMWVFQYSLSQVWYTISISYHAFTCPQILHVESSMLAQKISGRLHVSVKRDSKQLQWLESTVPMSSR
jgi:hypothetical protein